ncbi:MAG: TonB-dependent receptor [Novosphingobium sp.]|nr:TonB-dependent receptor [Novosphingobium sp.]
MKSSLRNKWLSSVAIALATAVANPAHAESAGQPGAGANDGQGIETIVVTAQRRAEDLQKSSVVIDVISPDQLARAGVASPDDLTRMVPSVSIATAAVSPQIYIRGVGDFAATQVNNPAVAVNLDGVYIARTASVGTDLFDLERVEVLKGPQGTLYGRNASGGAINLITRKPHLGVLEGNASVEVGNLDAVTLSGGLNIPVGDTLAVRVAGNLVRRDGYTTADRGEAKSEAVRVRALWEPSEGISLLLNGSYGHLGGRGSGTVIINGPAGMDPYTDNTSPEGIAYVNSKVYASGPDLRPLVTSPDSHDSFQDMDFWKVSAELNADLGFADLTVIPAYQNMKASSNNYPFLKVSFGAGFGNFPAKPETSNAYSLEVRLSHESDQLKWVLGGYFYDEQQYLQYTANAGLLQNTGRFADFDTRAYAVFGQATYSLTDNLRVIAGIRYTEDKRKMSNGATYILNPSYLGLDESTVPPTPIIFGGPDPAAVLLAETYSGKRKFKNASWKAGVEFDVTDDVMLFATASSGFKAGGFNTQQLLGAPAGSDEASAFDPEKLYAYDFGFRSRLFDNRLQLNGGLFYWDYRNQQFNLFAIGNTGNLSVVFDNAQKARMYGGYLDVLAKPWPHGTFNFSVEYNNSKYKKFTYETAQLLPGASGCAVAPAIPIVIGPAGPIMAVDCSGKPVQRAPKWTGGAGYTHTIDLANGGELKLSGDMTFTSSKELTIDFIPESHVGGYALFNASVTYTGPDNRFSLTAFVRNLTDEQAYNDGSEPNYAPGVMIGTIGLPRTYGVRAAFNF